MGKGLLCPQDVREGRKGGRGEGGGRKERSGGTEEIVQLVKHLLCVREALSSRPGTHGKRQVLWHASVISGLGQWWLETGGSPESPALLTESVSSRFPERPSKSKVESD